MGDLISRSALMKYLRDYKWEFALRSDFSKAIEMVDAQPTVESIPKEKVLEIVERLEEIQRDEYSARAEYVQGMSGISVAHCDGAIYVLSKVIEIVKGVMNERD